jgi:hypothetical protein
MSHSQEPNLTIYGEEPYSKSKIQICLKPKSQPQNENGEEPNNQVMELKARKVQNMEINPKP